MIRSQFDYVEVSLIKRLNLYTVAYSYVKANHIEQKISSMCMIVTGMTGFSYYECAKHVNTLLQMNFFTAPVIAYGMVYDEKMNAIQEIYWNGIHQEENTETSSQIH